MANPVFILSGGLGNQLFQFAYALTERGDRGFYVTYEPHVLRDFSLPLNDANILIPWGSVSPTIKLQILILRLITKIARRYVRNFSGISVSNRQLTFDRRRKCKSNKRISSHYYGYFQFGSLLIKQRRRIRNEFVRSKPHTAVNACCIIMRLGNDYTKDPGLNICDESYYRRAIYAAKEIFNFTEFAVFTDNREKAITILKRCNVKYDLIEQTDDPFENLTFASKYTHYILSNSSFAWWSFFLSEASSKNVVSPSMWYRVGDDDLVLDDFLKIEVSR